MKQAKCNYFGEISLTMTLRSIMSISIYVDVNQQLFGTMIGPLVVLTVPSQKLEL
jgi:hypothetical protein